MGEEILLFTVTLFKIIPGSEFFGFEACFRIELYMFDEVLVAGTDVNGLDVEVCWIDVDEPEVVGLSSSSSSLSFSYSDL